MGFIITIASQKGGSGKSAVTMQPAGVLSTRAEETRVLVIDADQQGTCLKWAAMAAEDTPFPATVMGMKEKALCPAINRRAYGTKPGKPGSQGASVPFVS